MSTGILIQARMGSTRMPGKVLQPFFGGQSILSIIVESLRRSKFRLPVVVATSTAAPDDAVVAWCNREGVSCFRGSENDVLQRFIGAAKEYRLDRVVRVCADNPFLDAGLMDVLLETDSAADYHSFLVDHDLPAIRSHWGIFTELVAVAALEKAAVMTAELFYHEHVTNFLYGNPQSFSLQWEQAPAEIFGRKDVRFTIDTPADFALMQQLWSLLAERGIPVNFKHALELLEEFPAMKKKMQEQIIANSK